MKLSKSYQSEKVNKSTKIREKLFELSGHCKQIEGDYKPLVQLCEFAKYQMDSQNNDFY